MRRWAVEVNGMKWQHVTVFICTRVWHSTINNVQWRQSGHTAFDFSKCMLAAARYSRRRRLAKENNYSTTSYAQFVCKRCKLPCIYILLMRLSRRCVHETCIEHQQMNVDALWHCAIYLYMTKNIVLRQRTATRVQFNSMHFCAATRRRCRQCVPKSLRSCCCCWWCTATCGPVRMAA